MKFRLVIAFVGAVSGAVHAVGFHTAVPRPVADLNQQPAAAERDIHYGQESGAQTLRIVLAGHSSGAQLSLLIATDPWFLARHELKPADSVAVIGLSAPVDLSRHPDGRGTETSCWRGVERLRSAATSRYEKCEPNRAYLRGAAPCAARGGRG